MTTLIIPDVHEKAGRLQSILALSSFEDCNIIFLGDFFDEWAGYTTATEATVDWLLHNVNNPKYTFIWGNHDLHYAFSNPGLRCSGWNPRTQTLVDRFLTYENCWNNFVLYAEVDKYLCSHAGFHPRLIDSLTINSAYKDWLPVPKFKIKKTVHLHPLFRAGMARGGREPVGGPTWLDWDREFTAIDDVHQIVGHTEHKEPQTLFTWGSDNYCLDTNLNHVALVTDSGDVYIEQIA